MWDKKWEIDFLFGLNILNEAECLVCSQKLKKKSTYSLKRHYEKCHPELLLVTGSERQNLFAKLMRDFECRNNNVLTLIKKNKSPCGLSPNKATYAIALELAKKGRPFEDGGFFKEMCHAILPFLGDDGQIVNQIIKEMPLSPLTISRHTEDIGIFLENQTQERLLNAKYMSFCLDESVHIGDTSQLIICVRTVDKFFNQFEEILTLETFNGNVTGGVIYKSFERNVLQMIDKNKISSICTNGAAVMVGQHNSFVGHLAIVGIHVPIFHCILNQQSLFAKMLSSNETMKMAIKIINRLKGFHNVLTHSKLIAFLDEVNDYYKDVLLFTEVKWLKLGKFLGSLFSLKEEISCFFHCQDTPNDVEIVNALNSAEFLLDLAFLTDMTLQINSLNLILQGENKAIAELFEAICHFSKKLNILKDQLAAQNLEHFPRINEIYTLHPKPKKLELFTNETKNLLNNFELIFKDVFELEWAIHTFNNPLTCDLKNVPPNIVFELVQMRQDVSIPLVSGVDFWKNINQEKYAASKDLALKIFAMFPSTYICESSFSAMSQMQNEHRNKLTSRHLEILLKIKFCQKETDQLEQLMDFVESQKNT